MDVTQYVVRGMDIDLGYMIIKPEQKQRVADSLQLMRRSTLLSLWRMKGRSWRAFSTKTRGVYATYLTAAAFDRYQQLI